MPECAVEKNIDSPEIVPQIEKLAITSETGITKTEAGITTTESVKEIKDSRGSISSVDSSISLSYDAEPFTPRFLLNATSSAEDRNNQSSSGVDSDSCEPVQSSEQPYEPPDEELSKKIVDQVEYYFSDENIVKDAFLLKHVRRNKEGYVSLKLIASFKRVKHIAKDWLAVRDALKTSKKLEINDLGTKLRRRDPLPLYDQTTPSRTVVAIKIPPEKATIESVAEMFRGCGEIALVRVLRPGNPVPADVRPFYNKHPEMHSVVSALVEFVRTESAHNALNNLSQVEEQGVRVLELNAPATRPKKNQQTKKFVINKPHYEGGEFSSSCASGSEPEDFRYKIRFQQRRCSSPLTSGSSNSSVRHPDQILWNQRRWSRDSGSDSPASSFSRSRSNSGACCGGNETRRYSGGWESGTDSYGSCRSRASSGASSIPEVFAMRRYSFPRRDSASSNSSSSGFFRRDSGTDCCCCAPPAPPILRFSTASAERPPLARSNSDGECRRDSREEGRDFYPCLHRRGRASSEMLSWQAARLASTDGNRRLSDSSSDGRRPPRILAVTQPHPLENVTRLPRGPVEGTRGFQSRDLIEYPLPE